MSRSQQSIFNASVTSYVAAAAAAGITIDPTRWSQFNIQRLILWTVAGAIAIFEQIFDNYVTVVDGVVAVNYPQTPVWIQNFVLNVFQYNSTTPQLIQLNPNTLYPSYGTINSAYRIVTQCVVVPGSFGTTTVKVAKSGPVALAAGELSALQSTLNIIGVPGISWNAVSSNADNIFIGGTVTYSGQYSGLIPVANGTVVQAIQSYLSSIPTSGVATANSTVGLMKLTDLIAAVRAVPGVIDFELNNVNARIGGAPYVPGANNLVSGNNWLQNEYNSGLSGAGYMITESSVGSTINDSITYIAA